ncbi:MAG: hypothetical protein QMD61_00915 [Methanobacterium sp.]|nr:hypothetical protein [Methanobacterium sp.]
MYIGIFSKKCIEYAEKLYPYSWRILSAEYGFMKGDDIVPAPYEACFHNKNSKPISVDELKIQAEDDALKEYNKIIVLGGKYYTNLIKSIFPHKYVYNPLEGCKGIGYMISRLNKAIKY